jgi:hypothetical protein
MLSREAQTRGLLDARTDERESVLLEFAEDLGNALRSAKIAPSAFRNRQDPQVSFVSLQDVSEKSRAGRFS